MTLKVPNKHLKCCQAYSQRDITIPKMIPIQQTTAPHIIFLSFSSLSTLLPNPAPAFGYGTGQAATQDSGPPQETSTLSPEQVPRGPDPSSSSKGVRTCMAVWQLNTDLSCSDKSGSPRGG